MRTNQLNQLKQSLEGVIIIVSISFLLSCGGGNDNELVENPVTSQFWETVTPDFSDNPDRPVIILRGDNTLLLNIGENYEDAGATADDLQDGDLSSQIVVDNPVDTSIANDYFVRYSVIDSSQLKAIEVVRIVRVFAQTPNILTPRPVGSTLSHLGYIEHLPANYTDNPEQKFPLLLFNHGSGSNAVAVGGTPEEALNSVLFNGGPPLLIRGGSWQQEDSFIMLAPQLGDPSFNDPIERIKVFVDYAISTYNIDLSRIYVTGWSQGGAVSSLYALDNPDRVAALVSISSGLNPNANVPINLCNIENIPSWFFHGDQDNVVPFSFSITAVETINNNCSPTIAPRLTIFQGESHVIHHGTFNLSLMENGAREVNSDPMYDLYDQSIFDWLLSQSLDFRGQNN